jgi:hypothetical protein
MAFPLRPPPGLPSYDSPPLRGPQAAPKGSVFLMHACAHNPTGASETLLDASCPCKQGLHIVLQRRERFLQLQPALGAGCLDIMADVPTGMPSRSCV